MDFIKATFSEKDMYMYDVVLKLYILYQTYTLYYSLSNTQSSQWMKSKQEYDVLTSHMNHIVKHTTLTMQKVQSMYKVLTSYEKLRNVNTGNWI